MYDNSSTQRSDSKQQSLNRNLNIGHLNNQEHMQYYATMNRPQNANNMAPPNITNSNQMLNPQMMGPCPSNQFFNHMDIIAMEKLKRQQQLMQYQMLQSPQFPQEHLAAGQQPNQQINFQYQQFANNFSAKQVHSMSERKSNSMRKISQPKSKHCKELQNKLQNTQSQLHLQSGEMTAHSVFQQNPLQEPSSPQSAQQRVANQQLSFQDGQFKNQQQFSSPATVHNVQKQFVQMNQESCKNMTNDGSQAGSNFLQLQGQLGSTPETKHSLYQMNYQPSQHQITNSASMSGQRSSHMFSPSTGSRGPNPQPQYYREFRKKKFEHQNNNVIKQTIEPQEQIIDSDGAMSNSLGSNQPVIMDGDRVREQQNMHQQQNLHSQMFQNDYAMSNQQCKLIISNIKDTSYVFMNEILAMVEDISNQPPINFDIARFKTNGIIWITILKYHAQIFKQELHKKYDYLEISQQQTHHLQDIPEEYAANNLDLHNDVQYQTHISQLNFGSDKQMSSGHRNSPMTAKHRMGLKTHRNAHKFGNDSFRQSNEILTHNPKVRGLDGLSYDSGGNRFVKNVNSQTRLFSMCGSDNTLQKKDSDQSFVSSGQHEGGPIDYDRIISGEETRTYLMVCNIPCRYSKDDIKQDFEMNHKGRFNDLHVPTDSRQPEKTNRAYCFINFRHVLFLYDFIQDKKNYHWPKYESGKMVDFKFGVQQPIQKVQEDPSQCENNSNNYTMTEAERDDLLKILQAYSINTPLERFPQIQSMKKPQYNKYPQKLNNENRKSFTMKQPHGMQAQEQQYTLQNNLQIQEGISNDDIHDNDFANPKNIRQLQRNLTQGGFPQMVQTITFDQQQNLLQGNAMGNQVIRQPWQMIKQNSHPMIYNQQKTYHQKNNSGQDMPQSFTQFQQQAQFMPQQLSGNLPAFEQAMNTSNPRQAVQGAVNARSDQNIIQQEGRPNNQGQAQNAFAANSSNSEKI